MAKPDERADSSIEIGLQVADAEPMLAFYMGALGFEPYGEIPMGHGHIWGLRWGGIILKLNCLKEPVEARNPPGRALGIRYFTLRMRDLPAVYERCMAAGATAIMPLAEFTTAAGNQVRFAMITDPEGNWIEMVEGLAWSKPTEAFLAGA